MKKIIHNIVDARKRFVILNPDRNREKDEDKGRQDIIERSPDKRPINFISFKEKSELNKLMVDAWNELSPSNQRVLLAVFAAYLDIDAVFSILQYLEHGKKSSQHAVEIRVSKANKNEIIKQLF